MQCSPRMACALAMVACIPWHSAFGGNAPTLKLMVQRGYLPGSAVLVRVDYDKTVWDGVATLTSDQPGITLSPNQVVLRNGRGRAFVTVAGAADFTLTAAAGASSASRSVRLLSSDPIVKVGGTLPGVATIWGGIVQITNDLTVPAGHTLTILSNTLVLVSGVASGTVAPDLLVAGTIQSLGTEDYPVTITSSNSLQWGQI